MINSLDAYESTVAELDRRSVFDATFFSDQRDMVYDIIVREKLSVLDALDVRWIAYQRFYELAAERKARRAICHLDNPAYSPLEATQ